MEGGRREGGGGEGGGAWVWRGGGGRGGVEGEVGGGGIKLTFRDDRPQLKTEQPASWSWNPFLLKYQQTTIQYSLNSVLIRNHYSLYSALLRNHYSLQSC